MTHKLFEYEYHREAEGAGEFVFRFRQPQMTIIPPETRQHLRAAQREFLSAIRSMLDSAIENIEEKEKQAPTSTQRHQIPVE